MRPADPVAAGAWRGPAGGPPRIVDALRAARAAGVDRLDAQRLLAHRLGRSREWLIAHDDTPLDSADAEAFAGHLRRRAAGEPLAYLTGRREFRGLELVVTPEVLVPRPETEQLVDWALELLDERAAQDAGARPAVADLGTGSGAIAVALAHARPAACVCATDLSPAALAVARINAGRHGCALELREGPWWQPLEDRRFELVLSNPPYIAAGDAHLQALRHEPMLALSPGGDGLGALREIAAGAVDHLLPGGWLLVEHGHDLGPAVRALCEAAGLARVGTRDDLAGLARCTGGQSPG